MSAISYEPVPNWGMLPQGISFGGDATSVAVDSQGYVYVFNRGTMPVVILDQNGLYVDSWGAGEFDSPHGIFIDDDDDLYLVDVAGHFVQKRTHEGKLLYTLGTRGEAAPVRSGRFFNRPTDVVVHPISRELFISDGYGNPRVHRFSSDGDYIASFGEPGADDGQFCLPHGIELLDGERLIVCDRENFRMQVFSTTGEYLEQWHAHRPSAVRRARLDECVFIAELGYAGQHGAPNMGCRVSVRNPIGQQVATLGDPIPGFDPGQFFAPHGLSMGPTGDLYIAEVNYSYTTRDLRRDPPRFEPISLRKWRRVVE